MKKLVLVMVCALIMVIFIGFNYLLWDRENREKDLETLQYSNVNNNATINALGRDLRELEQENTDLKTKVTDLEFENRLVRLNNQKLEDTKSKANVEMSEKNQLIDKLVQSVDLTDIQAPIWKWVDAVNKEDYQTAYDLMYRREGDQESDIGFADFVDKYKGIINSIKIKSIKLDPGDDSGKSSGEIVMVASLDIKKGEDVEKNNLNDGLNNGYYSMAFDKTKNSWVISKVLIVP